MPRHGVANRSATAGYIGCKRTVNGEAATTMLRVISGAVTAGLTRRSSTLVPTRHSVREAMPLHWYFCRTLPDGTGEAPSRL
jgi:hypothetical protein